MALLAPAPRHPTLGGMLSAAARHPSGVTFLGLREEEVRLSWAEVESRARRAAGALVARGVRPGDRVAIVLRTEPSFLDAFFGALHAGAVPVPLYPPVRLGRMDEYVEATARMLRVSGARVLVTSGSVARVIGRAVAAAGPGLDLGVLDASGLPEGRETSVPRAGGDLALVQFSSGSTVDPKPVALSHASLAPVPPTSAGDAAGAEPAAQEGAADPFEKGESGARELLQDRSCLVD